MIGPDLFALNLIRHAVTTDRVASVMARIAGSRIEVGPLRFGPGGTVVASGVGLIGPIDVTVAPTAGIGFRADIPGDLTIELTAGSAGRTHRYDGTVVVSLDIDLVLLPPAQVMLEVAPITGRDVKVKLHMAGVATFVLQTLGDADGMVAGQVAKVVNERVAAVADLRHIDIAALLDRAWDTEMMDLEARLTR